MPSKTQGIFPGMIICRNIAAYGTPSTYKFCDGTNGTRNLVDKFIIGAGNTYALGDTPGNSAHNHSHSGGSGGGGLTGGTSISTNSPLGIVTPGGPMTLNAGTYGNTNNLPPIIAFAYLQAKYVGAVPIGAIVWWTGTTANVPAGWELDTLIYNRFIIGSGNLYADGNTGGATTHNHTASATGTFNLSAGNTLLAGTDYLTSGTWVGGVTASTANLLPLYYGLIPIVSTGTRGIYTGMVLPYDGLIANLPATYAEYTGARNRLIMGSSTAGSTGGESTSHSHTGIGGGSGVTQAGTGIGIGTGTKVLQQLFVGNVTHGATSNSSVLPPCLALFYVIAL